jgi:hypothetical protein
VRDRGGCIDEERHLRGCTCLGELPDRLPSGDLMVGRLERGNGYTGLPDLCLEGIEVDSSKAVDGNLVGSTGCCGRM